MSSLKQWFLFVLGVAVVIGGAALMIRYWNLYTPEAINYIEAGGDPAVVASDADLISALGGGVLVVIGVTVIVVVLLRRGRRPAASDIDHQGLRASQTRP